jgi:hypothetical protein
MLVSIRLVVVVVTALAAVGCGAVTGGSGADANQDADTPDVPPAIDAPADQDATDADTRKCTVKINEVQTGGATALDEFIELYNTCPDRAFSLAGHSLVYRSATGTADFPRVTFTAETIAAGTPYFVCANSGFAGAADAHYTDGLALDGGGLALRGPDSNIVDAVGWGSAGNAFVETAPAPAPAAAQAIARRPDGHDSDDNSHDFSIATTPSPGAAN